MKSKSKSHRRHGKGLLEDLQKVATLSNVKKGLKMSGAKGKYVANIATLLGLGHKKRGKGTKTPGIRPGVMTNADYQALQIERGVAPGNMYLETAKAINNEFKNPNSVLRKWWSTGEWDTTQIPCYYGPNDPRSVGCK